MILKRREDQGSCNEFKISEFEIETEIDLTHDDDDVDRRKEKRIVVCLYILAKSSISRNPKLHF